jgi:23S rRNA (cytosine1962-C5)-methyltransferase
MMMDVKEKLDVLTPSAWKDYALLDSGDSHRFEEFGLYKLIRPDKQAIWKRGLPNEAWKSAHAEFTIGGGERGGQWKYRAKISDSWTIMYKDLIIALHADESRNLGVFPEQATHWDWLRGEIKSASRPVNILNLFGYTGLATIAAASEGARVTHVDASKRMIRFGRINQDNNGLSDHPIRWIIDDVFKFVRREFRRGNKYDGILMDPPKFGRGPKGEIWEVMKMLPMLIDECIKLLSSDPILFLVTAYSAPISAISLQNILLDLIRKFAGSVTLGEMGIEEKSLGRILPTAVYARWSIYNGI